MGNNELLSGADNARRRMGVSTNLTTIPGVTTFAEEITYDGNVRVGISGDANLLPDPQQLTDAFKTETDGLVSKYA